MDAQDREDAEGIWDLMREGMMLWKPRKDSLWGGGRAKRMRWRIS